MDTPDFLHAAHNVRNALDGLQLVSWAAIGLGAGALILSWGKILAWLRTPDTHGPDLVRWGEDDGGSYFEVARPGSAIWSAETHDGRALALEVDSEGLLRTETRGAEPLALVSSEGARLRL